MGSGKWVSAVAAAAFAVSAASPALTQESGDATVKDGSNNNTFSLELNNSRDVNGGCRLVYIARNGTDVPLDKTSYEVVVFDADKKVSQFLILEFGKLPVGKTKVVQFDLAGQPCAQISRLLINDVSECTSGGKEVGVCMDALKTDTRTDIDFGV